MNLSSEDSLRLHVLIANSIAVRIDEGTMSVYGLSKSGEDAKISLNPTGKAEKYVRDVCELLSSTVLGSPGGVSGILETLDTYGASQRYSACRYVNAGRTRSCSGCIGRTWTYR